MAVKTRRAIFMSLCLLILAFAPPLALSQASGTGQIQPQQAAHRSLIARTWKIAVVTSAAVLAAVALTFSVSVWRASNLFDREYRFPPVASAAIRLGADRCGGCMATIKFQDRGDPIRQTN